jgi:hypothetical protein
MLPNRETRTAVLVLFSLVWGLGLGASAHGQVRRAPASVRRADSQITPGRTVPASPSAGHARIEGVVVTRDEPPKPVKRATVRVRDLSGKVVGTSTTDDVGQFSFALDRSGAYYVELVDGSGRVLAVEDVGEVAISVGPGQVSTTILRVPMRTAAALWGRTATTIVGAAGAAGVGALVASGQPASPER